MQSSVRIGVERALGARVERVTALSGGDINQAFRVELSDGRAVFVKTNEAPPPDMYPAEAHGLGWLSEAKALAIPQVLAVSPAFLVLELLDGRPAGGFDEALGRGLAELHRFGAPSFGLSRDNFIGRLPQTNATRSTWCDFYRDCRLAPMVRSARNAGLLPDGALRKLDALCARLEELAGPTEPPARLHGDLWGGNLHVTPDGQPCLIDPAVYGGHREIDLAMMKLFGGFSAAVFSAYHEAWPLAPGHEQRVSLYQLYPLLVHVNLFGSSYVRGVEQALRQLV
jgi:fructosamine-3-kinase